MKRGYCEDKPRKQTTVICTGCGKEIEKGTNEINGKHFHNQHCWLLYCEVKHGVRILR